MKFKIEFNMDNDAFRAYPEIEVGRILRNVAMKVERGGVFGTCHDENGNRVGDWEIDTDEPEPTKAELAGTVFSSRRDVRRVE